MSASSATALPYFSVTGGGGFQPFGLLALLGVTAGVLIVVFGMRKRGAPGGDIGLIVPIATIAVMFGSHVYDVAWNNWDRASDDPKLWLRLYEGVSVFGGVFGGALVVWAIARTRKTPLAAWADCTALGLLVGLAIGRIGCTLVHDHLGTPTDLPIGLDVPADRIWIRNARELLNGAKEIRLHDVGMEELALLIPLVIAAFVLRKRFAPGILAAVIAIGYAVIRFPLDFLRLPDYDPTRAGLTGGQWGCVILVVATVIALSATGRARRAGSR